MATYKKKVKHKDAQKAQVLEESTTENVFNTLDETANISENWVEKNQKILLGGLTVVVACILLFLGYQKYMLAPKEREAIDELFYPKQTFNQLKTTPTNEKDSIYRLALEGIDGKYGFEDIATIYSGTKGGNLATYYVGISYFGLGEYKKAIEWLDRFEANDAIVPSIKYGAIGDAYANLNELEKALESYKKATSYDNDATTPLYLFKAGNIAFTLKKYLEAVSLFEKIKKDYADSTFATQIEMHINKAKYAE